MFYVYDLDGLRFQGSLEDLERNLKVKKGRAVKSLKGGEQPPQLSLDQPYARNIKAVKAYQQTNSRKSMVEPLVHIRQIMSSPVSTIGGNIYLYHAWSMLKDSNIRQLVVTSSTKEVLGILSDRDILQHINVIDDEVTISRDLLVSEIVSPETYTTDASSDIRRVARVMAYYHLDAMPVMEDRQLVGIVTRGDILRGFAENPKLNLWA